MSDLKKFKVKWNKTVKFVCESEVEAKDADEAADIAINGYKGRHGNGQYEWPDIEEREVGVIEETKPTAKAVT